MITAIIPVHNRADLLATLLASIKKQTLAFTDVLAIDNASTDNAMEVARAFGCRVLSMGENAGFARAVNAGWKASGTPWVAILNSDVELDREWSARLMERVEGKSFATGTIYSAQDRRAIDGTYDLMSRAGCSWRAGNGEQASHPDQPIDIAIAPATACLYRREVLEKLGGFDESFGSYLEDVDLGLRCVREGLAGVYVPSALAWHHGSATFGRWNAKVVRLISRNQLLLVEKHYDTALFRQCLGPIFAGQLLWGLLALRHGAPLAWIAGKLDGLRHFHLHGQPSARLREFLNASESEIRERAKDSYWRWYFRLTSGVAH